MNKTDRKRSNMKKYTLVVSVVLWMVSAWYLQLSLEARQSARDTLRRSEMVQRAIMEWDGCPEYKGDDDDKTN